MTATEKRCETLDLAQMIDWVEYQIVNLEEDTDCLGLGFVGSDRYDNYIAMKNILGSLGELKGWRNDDSVDDRIMHSNNLVNQTINYTGGTYCEERI